MDVPENYQDRLRKFNYDLRYEILDNIKAHFKVGAEFIQMANCPIGKWIQCGKGSAKSLKPWQRIVHMRNDYYQVQHSDGDYYPLQKLPLRDLCELADYLNENS